MIELVVMGVLPFVSFWVGWVLRGIRLARQLQETLRQERTKRANDLRTHGRLSEPHPDNGPPSRSVRVRVVGQMPERPDKPPTRL